MCNHKAKAELYRLATSVYDYYKEGVMCAELSNLTKTQQLYLHCSHV